MAELAGAPCWIELFTSDPPRSHDFYDRLFGWTTKHMGEEYGGYVNFLADGQLVGGCMRNDGSARTPDVWTVYFETADAEATTANGGTIIVPAMQVMDLGRMVVVQQAAQDTPYGRLASATDPTGAAFKLLQR